MSRSILPCILFAFFGASFAATRGNWAPYDNMDMEDDHAVLKRITGYPGNALDAPVPNQTPYSPRMYGNSTNYKVTTNAVPSATTQDGSNWGTPPWQGSLDVGLEFKYHASPTDASGITIP